MTDNSNIIMLFPTCIYRVSEFADDILEDLKETSISLENEYGSSRSSSLNVDSTHLTISNKLPYIKPFDNLKERIQKQVDKFCYQLGITENVKIANMWFNISNKGDFNFPHSHPGSIISGVFYIESLGSSDIVFYNNHYLVNNFICSGKENNLSRPDLPFRCMKGELLMWPGHIVHGNPAQKDDGQKIALSFNSLIETGSL